MVQCVSIVFVTFTRVSRATSIVLNLQSFEDYQSCSYPQGRCQPFCRTSDTQDINSWNKFENNTIKITVTSHSGQWIKQYFLFPSSFQRLVAARLTVEWPSVIGETLWTRTRKHKPSTPSSTMAGMSSGRHCTLPYIYMMYRKISNISCTKFQNLNVSHLGLQWSLRNILKAYVKWRMKM